MNSYYYEFLGYDLRVDREQIRLAWTSERRQAFLLNPDIAIPLSVDVACWPSMFDYRGKNNPNTPVGRSESISVTPTTFYQDMIGFWPDLAEMRKALPSQKHGLIVATKVFSKNPLFDSEFWRGTLTGFPIPEPDLGTWNLVGFDVADEGRISGLCNCKYEASEASQLDSWKSKLNEHGLFSMLDEAISFVDVTKLRVKEHAPFYVYGLYTPA